MPEIKSLRGAVFIAYEAGDRRGPQGQRSAQRDGDNKAGLEVRPAPLITGVTRYLL